MSGGPKPNQKLLSNLATTDDAPAGTWVRYLRSSLGQMSRPLAGAVAEIIEGQLGREDCGAGRALRADGLWAVEPYLYGNTYYVRGVQEAAHLLAAAWLEGMWAGQEPAPEAHSADIVDE